MKQMNKQENHRYRARRGGCQSGGGLGEERNRGKIRRHKRSVTKEMSHRYKRHSVGDVIVNN